MLNLLLFILSYAKFKTKLASTFFFFQNKIVTALIDFNYIRRHLDGIITKARKTDIESIECGYTHEIRFLFVILLYSIFVLFLLYIY